ncbi:MAG: hypothetical protein FWD68_21010, partial [Alphaproteobacteria bacterium]|nr:hypothetical protein [Alphaproteobacteria bacterium]
MSADIENATLRMVSDMRDAVTASLLEMHGLAEMTNNTLNAGLSGVNTRIDAFARGLAGTLNQLRDEVHVTNERVDHLAAAVGETNERVDHLAAAVGETNERVDHLAAAVG